MIGINGKTSSEIAREYGISPARVRQWAKENSVPYIGTEDRVAYYVFDKETEEKFRNRPKESPGRPVAPKPPKVPGKPGRPRKEKPADTVPKRPIGRPRKNPPKDVVIAPRRPRGRPRKEG
jgi:transcriptional regulator with XRE-family HTH domain